jgi:hypothetical protein
MKLVSKFRFFTGLFIPFVLFLSYFIRYNSEYGNNYVVEDSLFGVLIFHNAYILALYLTISIILIITGVRKVRFV